MKNRFAGNFIQKTSNTDSAYNAGEWNSFYEEKKIEKISL